MALPIYKSDDKDFMLMQSNWSSQLNPILAKPTTSSLILKNVSLINGTNTINHLLSRNLQGWSLTRQRAAAAIYDQQDSNPNPQLTLVLISDADVVVDLEVF